MERGTSRPMVELAMLERDIEIELRRLAAARRALIAAALLLAVCWAGTLAYLIVAV